MAFLLKVLSYSKFTCCIYLREELRDMHLDINEDNLFPAPGELKGIMAQFEALLELVEGNTRIQSNSEAA